MRRLSLLLVLLVAVMFTVMGCAGGQKAVEQAQRGAERLGEALGNRFSKDPNFRAELNGLLGTKMKGGSKFWAVQILWEVGIKDSNAYLKPLE